VVLKLTDINFRTKNIKLSKVVKFLIEEKSFLNKMKIKCAIFDVCTYANMNM